ncbi:MAG: hypothetical protein GX221_05470 [Candidatus Riflebacteria bacterium]|nr:hypothetical protein [Candidatus Riflebacteria bacterium]
MKKNQTKAIIALFLLSILLISGGCIGKSESTQEGSITGVVRDSSGNPLSGAKVRIGPRMEVSDIYGLWAMENIRAEIVEIVVSKTGYQTQSRKVEIKGGTTLERVAFFLPAAGELQDVSVTALTPTSCTITYQTDYKADVVLKYGQNMLFDYQVSKSDLRAYTHVFEVENLKPATTYMFKCVGKDEHDRNLESAVLEVTTPESEIPQIPEGLKASYMKAAYACLLEWDLPPGRLMKYNLYKSDSKNGVFDKINEKPFSGNNYLDNEALPGQKNYYRLSAVSPDGVESQQTPPISFVLPGRLDKNIIWTKSESPYKVPGDLIIPEGKSLVIDKGVLVMFPKPTTGESEDALYGIDVYGTLIIRGTLDEKVLFTSSEVIKRAGDYRGINFYESGDISASTVAGLELDSAVTGIKAANGGLPRVTDSVFSNCSNSCIYIDGLREETELERLTVTNSWNGIVVKNCEQKVRIAENLFMDCANSIVCEKNSHILVEENKIVRSGSVGIALNNLNSNSKAIKNIVGWNSNGIGIKTSGADEVRRNTLHTSGTCIVVEDSSTSAIRSNLLLADRTKNITGLFYSSSSGPYSDTSPNRILIQNNAVWNQIEAVKKYSNTDGTPLTVFGDLVFTSGGPAFISGDPFVGIVPDDFTYKPAHTSQLKSAGYNFEDAGAYDVPVI